MQTLNLTIPGFTIACKTWGDKNLPPLLALHGWLDNANSFEPIAPFLENQFYVIAVDLPGHGFSSHPPPGCNYHFIDGIFTIIAIMNALEFNNVHLLGHSMGACLASLVAGVVPLRILSMALIEGLGPFASPDETCQEQLHEYVQNRLTKKNNAINSYRSLELAALARAKNGHLSIEHARILCQRGVDEENNRFYWRHDRRLVNKTPLRLTEVQILSCLKSIKAKSCLIWAENGFAFDEFTLQQRANCIENLLVYKMDGGHHIHMEKPDAVAQRLAEFYSTV